MGFSFQEIEFKNTFYAEPTDNTWALENGLTHVINEGYRNSRFARILKTVAYVAVDEDENGPVLEKWNIRRI